MNRTEMALDLADDAERLVRECEANLEAADGVEQARIVQLLVERVSMQEDALEVRVRAEGPCKSYVSRILRLEMLAPDTVEAILAGRMKQALTLVV